VAYRRLSNCVDFALSSLPFILSLRVLFSAHHGWGANQREGGSSGIQIFWSVRTDYTWGEDAQGNAYGSVPTVIAHGARLSPDLCSCVQRSSEL